MKRQKLPSGEVFPVYPRCGVCHTILTVANQQSLGVQTGLDGSPMVITICQSCGQAVLVMHLIPAHWVTAFVRRLFWRDLILYWLFVSGVLASAIWLAAALK